MKEKIEEIKKDKEEIFELGEKIDNSFEFMSKQMERNYQREKFHSKILFIIIIVLLLIIGYDSYMDANSTVMETSEQEGIYNYIDSEGNMISSDLSLEDMKELIRINGENKEN